MPENNQEFMDSITKEMREKFEERNKQLEELEKQALDDEVKEATRKEIMDDFYKQLEEMKKRPGYEEARKGHAEKLKTKIAGIMDPEDEKLLDELKKAQEAEKRVKIFSKLMDVIPTEALIGLFIEEYGDIGMAVICTTYLLAEGIHAGLPWQDCLKIVGLQAADLVIGAIPILGDIGDFAFTANLYSVKYFSKKVNELEKAAEEKGIDPKKIEEMKKNFENEGSVIEKVLNNLKKSKNGSKGEQ